MGVGGGLGVGPGRGPGNGEQERQVGSSGCGAPLGTKNSHLSVIAKLPPGAEEEAGPAQRCVQIPASLAVGPWANALISLNSASSAP